MSLLDKKKITIVLDTEFKSSNMITGDCLQLGFVAIFDEADLDNLDDDHWIVSYISVCFLSQDKDYEDGVMNFWSNFPEVYNKIMSEAGPIDQKMYEVKEWLNNLSEAYEISNFMSDISCVDFTWFRNLYLTYCTTEGDKFFLPYKAICGYSMEEALIIAGIDKKEIRDFYQSERFPHTHYALEDALKTAYEYLRLKLFIRNRITRRLFPQV